MGPTATKTSGGACAPFLKENQEPTAPVGRWVNYIYGTWSVSGPQRLRERHGPPYIRKAVEWLVAHQNPDGGWGECCESYYDPKLAGTGPSTASQTGWALLSMLAAGDVDHPAVARGIRYLIETQKPDGTWDEDQFTGTGFPKYFMIKYHIYRNCFPLMALGRYRAQKRPKA